MVYDINTTIWQTGVENNKLSNELSSLNNNATRKSLLDHVDQAVKVSDQMRKVHREANDISSDVFKLKSKLNALEPQWDSQFGGAQENGKKKIELFVYLKIIPQSLQFHRPKATS